MFWTALFFISLFIFLLCLAVSRENKHNSSYAAQIRKLTKGKNREQKKVIMYFCKKGCLTNTISDKEYLDMVYHNRDSMNFKQRALSKIDLDEDKLNEIPPVMFEGFYFDGKFAKQNSHGKWVSSAYQVSWMFFSSTQIYLYSCTFNMDEDKNSEFTAEFFFKDVTSFSTSTQFVTAHGIGKEAFEIASQQFKLVVPGDQIFMVMGNMDEANDIIMGLKHKLREKKL